MAQDQALEPALRPRLCPRPADAPRKLSLGQEQLWYLDQLAPGNPVYNVPFSSRLTGPIDPVVLERSIEAVVERHEALRTVILSVRGVPRPVLLKKWALDFESVDLRYLTERAREEQAQCHIRRKSRQAFDFARDVMLRCLLLRLTEDDWIFLHSAPHLTFEGASLSLLYRDLGVFYSALIENRHPQLPELNVQYADFAHWQRLNLTGSHLDELNRYWGHRLAGAPTLSLPYDFPRPELYTMRGRRLFFSLPVDLLSRARRYFEQRGVSRYSGLLSVFYLLLYRYSRMTDLSVGSPFRVRCDGIEDLIGFFVNTVALRTILSVDSTFDEILRQVNATVRSAVEHSDLTFDKVVEAVKPVRDPSRTPLFQVNFRAPKQPYPSLQLPDIHSQCAQYVDNGTAKFDLALEIDSATGKTCYFEYCTDLFSHETILRAISDYQALLTALIETPGIPVKDLCL